MPVRPTDLAVRDTDRIHIDQEYELCVWARYFNASEKRVKEAVAAVGDRAVRVRDHLRTTSRSERPAS
jgi:hypothetical protein